MSHNSIGKERFWIYEDFWILHFTNGKTRKIKNGFWIMAVGLGSRQSTARKCKWYKTRKTAEAGLKIFKASKNG